MKASAFLLILSVAVSNAQVDDMPVVDGVGMPGFDGGGLPPPTTADEVCDINAPCSVEGSSCTNGQTETCCGETYDSFRCDCSNGKYMCMYTDRCMYPICEPVVDGGGMPVVVVEDSIPCETGPAAQPEKGCSDGEFCILASPTTELDIGVCNNKSGVHTGVCQAGGEMCTMDYTPVCGCDGKTYGNECVAHSEGVSVARIGECEDKVDISDVDVTFTPDVVTVDVVAEPVAKPEDATAPSTTVAVPETADVAADVAAPADPAPAVDVAADVAAPADPAPAVDVAADVAPDSNVGATFVNNDPDCGEDCGEDGTFESSANGLGGVPMMVAASVVSSLVSIMLA